MSDGEEPTGVAPGPSITIPLSNEAPPLRASDTTFSAFAPNMSVWPIPFSKYNPSAIYQDDKGNSFSITTTGDGKSRIEARCANGAQPHPLLAQFAIRDVETRINTPSANEMHVKETHAGFLSDPAAWLRDLISGSHRDYHLKGGSPLEEACNAALSAKPKKRPGQSK